jgi:hypothetical protein
LGDRDYPGRVNFCRNGALKQTHGYHDSVVAFAALQDSLESAKSAMLDSHSLTDLGIRPRSVGETGTYQHTNGLDFDFLDGNRFLAYANDGNKAWRLQNWKSVLRVKSAEEVPWKQGKFDFLDSVRPLPPARVSRQKPLIPFSA